MKKTILLASLFSGLIVSFPSQARDGITLNLAGGYTLPSGLPSVNQQAGATTRTVNHFNTGQVLLGYYHQLNPTIDVGFLIGYGKYGQVDYTIQGVKYKTNVNDILFTGGLQWHMPSWHMTYEFLGGLARNGFVVETNANKVSSRVTQAYLGLNVLYNITPHLSAGLGYNHIFGSKINDVRSINDKAPRLDNILASLQYTF